MFELNGLDSDKLISRIKDVSQITLEPPVQIVTDTRNYAKIIRGQVIRLEGRSFLIAGDVYEYRFGLEGQPKFWVKQGYDLEHGGMVIIKFEYHEEFVTKVGQFSIPCFRSPKKESEVLQFVKGDLRFMQGKTFFDNYGNNVRVLEFISGNKLYDEILGMEQDHEQYYYTCLPSILKNFVSCCEAIQMLNENDLCHGDIRNDHIIIDHQTGKFRWIDFDLYQNFDAFDVWSLGRILHFVTGQGFNTFREIRTSGRFPDAVISNLRQADANMFFPDRMMNLKKIYPYIDEKLNGILMRFSLGTKNYYSNTDELVRDLKDLPLLC